MNPISFQSPLAGFQQEWGRSKDIKRIDTDENCDRPAPVRHPCIRSRSGTRFLPPYCLPTWSDRHTAGIRTEYGDHIRFPEEGGKVFHRLVHAVETLLHLASRSLPGPSLSGCAQPPVSRGPRCNCARIRRFPRQVTFHHLQITPVEVARVEVRCLFGHHLLVKQFF